VSAKEALIMRLQAVANQRPDYTDFAESDSPTAAAQLAAAILAAEPRLTLAVPVDAAEAAEQIRLVEAVEAEIERLREALTKQGEFIHAYHSLHPRTWAMCDVPICLMTRAALAPSEL
jgi:hypothetical protein